MFNINSIDSDDFYYNGHWLSEYNGIIAGKSGLSPFSIVPSKSIQTETILGLDGEMFVNANYNPRTFTVPIFFEKIEDMRAIASWLNVKQPTDFYFKNDNLKIKAMFDSSIELEHGICNSFVAGTIEIKFISHDIYFQAINDIKYILNQYDKGYVPTDPLNINNEIMINQDDKYNPVEYIMSNTDIESLSKSYNWNLVVDGIMTKNDNVINIEAIDLYGINIFNDGNIESFPTFKITGKGSIKITLNKDKSFTVSNIEDYVYIDMKHYAVYRDASTPMLNNYDGDFFTLPNGINYITITPVDVEEKSININSDGKVQEVTNKKHSTFDNLEIQCNSRWI